jgi:hypothetical protein
MNDNRLDRLVVTPPTLLHPQVLDHVVTSPQCLIVGSSMGGWVACLVALLRPERVAGKGKPRCLCVACLVTMTFGFKGFRGFKV